MSYNSIFKIHLNYFILFYLFIFLFVVDFVIH